MEKLLIQRLKNGGGGGKPEYLILESKDVCKKVMGHFKRTRSHPKGALTRII